MVRVFVPVQPRPAPASTVGALGWIRANLLSSPFNIAMTIAALCLLYIIAPPMLNWLIFEATIGGGSVASCKTLVGGEVVDAPGACWTFIKVRFLQLMFGLYYSGNLDQVWRPILMFALFVALMIPLFITGFAASCTWVRLLFSDFRLSHMLWCMASGWVCRWRIPINGAVLC